MCEDRWRDIESAPKDAWILAATLDGQFDVIRWDEYDEWDGWFDGDSPIHWQPLPPPPKEQ